MQKGRDKPFICSPHPLSWLPLVKTRNKGEQGWRGRIRACEVSRIKTRRDQLASNRAGEDAGLQQGGSNFLLWEGKCERVVRTAMGEKQGSFKTPSEQRWS